LVLYQSHSSLGAISDTGEVERPTGPATPTSSTSVEPPGDCAAFWLDLQGRVTRWTTDCDELFGPLEQGAVGFPFAELFTEDDRELGIPDLALAQAHAAGAWDDLGWRIGPDGAHFWAASSVTLQRTPNGVPIGFRVLTYSLPGLTDMSSGGDLDADLSRLISIGRVAADVSHDIRNILTAIRGFAGLLERDLPAGGAAHHVWFELLTACDRGMALTGSVLHLGDPERPSESVDLGEVVRGSEKILQQVIRGAIELSVAVDDDLPLVRGSTADLELALMNLVVNARDAIEGTGSIHVSVRREDAVSSDVPRVVLSVEDSGTGMTAEVKERVLERFFTTKGAAGGSGLGLAIVRDTVHSAGGTIDIDSSPGTGTSVHVAFPPAATLAVTRGRDAGAEVTSERPHVLVHSSCGGLRECLVGFLEREGHVVVVQADHDGPSAWHDQALSADLAVMDLVLPSSTGPAVMAEFRARGGTGSAIFLSDSESAAASEMERVDPADRVMYAPFSPNRFRELVGELLSHSAPELKLSVH